MRSNSKLAITTCIIALTANSAYSLTDTPQKSPTPPNQHIHDSKPNRQTPQPPHTHINQDLPFLQQEHLTGNWNNYRTKLENLGFAFEATLTTDYYKNLKGGLDTQGDATRRIFEASTTIDLGKIANIQGLTLNALFITNNGQFPADEVGNVQQDFTDINTGRRTQFDELYFQYIISDSLKIKLGKLDTYSDFSSSIFAQDYQNIGIMNPATLVLARTVPDTAFGGVIFYNPTPNTHINLGIYDGAADSANDPIPTGKRGPKSLWESPDNMFYIAEFGYHYSLTKNNLPGHLTAGLWSHQGNLTKFDNTTTDQSSGYYVTLDQALHLESPDNDQNTQGLYLSAIYGYANPEISPFNHHISTALTYQGPIPSRDNDTLGLGITYAKLSNKPGAGFTQTNEAAFELFYKFQLTPFFSIKPDIQHITNPAGTNTPNATVFSLRAQITF